MTVTTVRPNTTDRNANVTTSGGASAFSVVDDSPDNDATFAQGNLHGAYLWLGLGTVAVSSSVRLKQARARLRITHDGVDVGWPESVNVALRDPTTNTVTTDLPATDSVAGVDPWTGAWSTAGPGGQAWTQAIIDRLQLKIFWRASHNGQFLKITEAYVDYDTNAQPTVTSVIVTGNTSTTRPAATWTYGDTDGDPQVALQARVFTSAQYGITGFDPATSPNTWDSGVLLSDADNITIGTDLVNTVTYKVYVNAAQQWLGPEGAYWWSGWAASSAFTITLTPPATPTVTVQTETALPGYRNRVTVSLAGLNLLSADSAAFEGGVGDWLADSNCSITTSATNPKSGALALQMTATGAGNMAARSGSGATGKRVTPGATYTGTASFRAAVTARTVNTGIRWLNVSGGTVTEQYGTNQTDGTGGYVTATFTGAAPAAAHTALVMARVTSAGAAEVHRVDEAALMPGSGTTWTPGGYVTGGLVQIERVQRVSDTIVRGPAHNWVHPQLYSAGALTTNTDGWYPRQANDSVAFRYLDRAPPESTVQTTAGMVEWQIRVGASSFLDIGGQEGVATDGTAPYLMPAVPLLGMTASLWLWSSAAVTVRLGVVYVDNVNTQVGSTQWSAATALTTAAQRIAVSTTPPAGCVWARLVVEDNSSTADVSVYATQPRFRLSTAPDDPWPGQVFFFERENMRGASAYPIPTDGRVSLTLFDHEPPAGRPVLYTARLNCLTGTGTPVSSDRSTPVPTYSPPPDWTLLKDPYQAENAVIVFRAPGDQAAPAADETELHPAGRDRDPVFTRDWVSGEQGTLTVHLLDDLAAYRLQQLVPSPRTLLVQWSNGGNMYVRITGQSITHVRGNYRVASLAYTQQARPA